MHRDYHNYIALRYKFLGRQGPSQERSAVVTSWNFSPIAALRCSGCDRWRPYHVLQVIGRDCGKELETVLEVEHVAHSRKNEHNTEDGERGIHEVRLPIRMQAQEPRYTARHAREEGRPPSPPFWPDGGEMTDARVTAELLDYYLRNV